MKKIAIFAVVFILMASVFVTAEQNNETGNMDSGQPELTGSDESGQGNEEANQGEETQLQNQVTDGEYTCEDGSKLQIQKQEGNKMQLQAGNMVANTNMEMTQEQVGNQTRLRVKLSNGANAEVKIMPDAASVKAMEQLRLNVCSEENACQMELKEVGQGEQMTAAYEVKAQKKAKLFGFIDVDMDVDAQINAESGEIIRSGKPWWAFLATETEE
jgi:hypothetical protein